MAKVEGEADYFGKMGGVFYSHGGSRETLIQRRKVIGERVGNYLVELEKIMKERIEELEIIRGLILRNYEIFVKLTKEIEKLDELLKIAGKENNYTEWLRKTEVFRKAIQKDVMEFSSNTNKLSKFVSKVESKLYSGGEYELGFSLIHYLTKSKQYRYTMKSRSLVDKFTESRRFSEANQLKKDLKAMVFLMDAIEQLIVDFEKVIPIEKGALRNLGYEFTQILQKSK